MPVQGKQSQPEVKKPAVEKTETEAKSILKVSADEPSKKKDKKKKKKTKGIDAFMENDEEAKAFAAEEVKPDPVVEEKPKKAKKSVNFNLDQNEVREFDKTKKIAEVDQPDEEEKEAPV
jgi:hypothetical protein